MSRKFLILLLGVVVFASGCDQASENPVQQTHAKTKRILIDEVISIHGLISAKLDEQFQLTINQTAFIKSEDIKIKFLTVAGDSRCPSDVVCIWAGQVEIIVNISKGCQNLGDFSLINSAGNKNLALKSFDGYSITLVKVDPYPKSTQKIELSDYIITLVVART